MTQDEKKRDQKLKEIENYEIELQLNPKSVRFVQLADLYIMEKRHEDALELLTRSLKYHPNSVSGHLLKGKTLQRLNRYDESLEHFSFAIQKAPTNWNAYLLRGETYLKLKQTKLALKDYKNALLHNPTHPIARRAVAKLEVYTADEYEESLFEMKSLKDVNFLHSLGDHSSQTPDKKRGSLQAVNDTPTSQDPLGGASDPTVLQEDMSTVETMSPALSRILSLIDAFTVRHEYEKAIKLLKEAKIQHGDHSEISNRLLRLSQYENAQKIRPRSTSHLSISRSHLLAEKKLKALELLLRRIREMNTRPLES